MIPEFFIFLAEPFGFGPISSSIAIARQVKLLSQSHKCVFIGCGTSYQLALQSNLFDEIYFTDNLTESYLTLCNDRVEKWNSIVIANTYPAAVTIAKQAGFKCIFVDTLFWMWNSLPIDISNVSRYYIEDFHCVPFAIDKFGYSEKFRVVPPLIDIDVAVKPVRHPFLLVSLGGIDSNSYDFPVFYQRLIEHISRNEKFQQFTILVCGGGKKIHGCEFLQFENDQLTIACLSPHEYISHLKAADLVLASAGLHGFYENYFLKKNVMFLPPQSYSQYLQLKFIKNNFCGVLTMNFEDIGLSHTLRENMPDSERIQEVKRMNRALIDDNVFDCFLEKFEKFYSGSLTTDWSDEIIELETTLPGPVVLTKDILSLIENI